MKRANPELIKRGVLLKLMVGGGGKKDREEQI